MFLLVCGTLAALLHGAALPVALYMFGDITDTFFSREVTYSPPERARCPRDPTSSPLSLSLANSSSALTPNCATPTYKDLAINATCTNFTLKDVLSVSVGSEATCLTNDLFIKRIDELVLVFIGIAVGVFVFGVFQVWFYRLAAERQVLRIRLHYYRAVLKQALDLGWFDLQPRGIVDCHLSR